MTITMNLFRILPSKKRSSILMKKCASNRKLIPIQMTVRVIHWECERMTNVEHLIKSTNYKKNRSNCRETVLGMVSNEEKMHDPHINCDANINTNNIVMTSVTGNVIRLKNNTLPQT